MRATPPRLLTIAGSDSGGGAGIQADLKTFAAHGVYGMSVVTAVTAQNTRGVRAIHPIPPEVVAAQIDAVFDDMGVDAVKIGMLSSPEIVSAVAEGLARGDRARGLPVVLDPVMVAESGDPLISREAVAAIEQGLFPLATVTTPNLPEAERLLGPEAEQLFGPEAERLLEPEAERLFGPEAERLLGCSSRDLRHREEAARELGRRTAAVLLKGGHGQGDEVVDLLWDGSEIHRWTAPRIQTTAGHGTGCTLSSAIACRLAAGADLPVAVRGAIEYVRGALAAAYPLGSGAGPVDHLYRLTPS